MSTGHSRVCWQHGGTSARRTDRLPRRLQHGTATSAVRLCPRPSQPRPKTLALLANAKMLPKKLVDDFLIYFIFKLLTTLFLLLGLLTPKPVPADLSVPWASLGRHRQTNLAVYQMCKSYGKKGSPLAVDHVSFALHPNEGLGLIGSNGLSFLWSFGHFFRPKLMNIVSGFLDRRGQDVDVLHACGRQQARQRRSLCSR